MDAPEPSRKDVMVAAGRVYQVARRTPIVHTTLPAGAPLSIKDESAQATGSFKVRGAANAVLALTDEDRSKGVVAVSSGNHGRAVAHVAEALGTKATICLTTRVPANKVEAIQGLGAETVIAGDTQEEAERHARRLGEEGMVFIHPFDDPEVIAGQGTVGMEVLDDEPALDTIVVPVSGGGLVSGIGLALEASQRSIRLVGASQDRGPAMHASMAAGKPTPIVEEDTLADALAGGLGAANRYTLRLCLRLLDDLVLVSEDEIAAAMAFAHRRAGMKLEGGGAVAIGALLAGKVDVAKTTVAVASGGNVDPATFDQVLSSH